MVFVFPQALSYIFLFQQTEISVDNCSDSKYLLILHLNGMDLDLYLSSLWW